MVLYAFRCFHYRGLLKQNKGYYGKYKSCLMENNDYEVIFLGSSRVEMHYNTHLFDSLTQLHSFNLSMAGATPQMSYALLKIYLQQSKTPDLLFYDVDLNNLKTNKTSISDFNNFFPFLSNPVVRNEFNRVDPRMNHFYYNPYYSLPFSGIENLSTSAHGWLNIPNKTDAIYYKGYLRDTIHNILTYQKVFNEFAYLSQNRRDYLDSIIQICKLSKIKLILISSPMFAGGQLDISNKKQISRQMEYFAKSRQVPYWDLSSLPFCNRRELFADHHHMNAKGAKVFCSYLVDFFNNKTNKVSLN